jgi:hypothetical protein
MDEVIWFADVLERTEEENKKFLDRNIALVREAEEVDQILGKALGWQEEDIRLRCLAEGAANRIGFLEGTLRATGEALADSERGLRNATLVYGCSIVVIILVITVAIGWGL